MQENRCYFQKGKAAISHFPHLCTRLDSRPISPVNPGWELAKLVDAREQVGTDNPHNDPRYSARILYYSEHHSYCN